MVLPREQPKLSPQTELSLLPHTTTLPTTTGSGKYNLVMNFHVHRNFLQMFHSYDSYFSLHHLWSYHGKGQNSSHRVNLASRSAPPPIAQQREYFCDEFLGPLHFI
jgi:hypothetical protein